MFREMRKKKREIGRDEAIMILKNGEYGVLSTIGADGYPYGVPVNYAYFDGAVYFHCATEGHKLDNISNSERVSFCVVGRTRLIPERHGSEYESAILFGRAREVHDNEKERALFELLNKYAAVFKEKGTYVRSAGPKTRVIKIQPEHISGKAR